MLPKNWLGIVSLFITIAMYSGNAYADGKIQQYLNGAAQSAQATTDPAQKRALLDNEYRRLSTGLNIMSGSSLVSTNDRAALQRVDAMIREKRDELNGRNGFARVADDRIDAFAQYVVQDMEQADTVITISLVTLLLILILVVLIVR